MSTSYEIFRILPLQFPTSRSSGKSSSSAKRRNLGGDSILLADMLGISAYYL